MMRTKLVLLGLCVVLVGMMAFSASGAQAAKWLILTSGGVVKTGEELKSEIKGELESLHLTIHFQSPVYQSVTVMQTI
jgi:hypothetical protein